jgi:hypothetical protein
VVDGLAGGNRERAGATPGGGGGCGSDHTDKAGGGSETTAREPQRPPRRGFLLTPPLGVTRPMKTRSRLAVRRFLPILPSDDRLATVHTGGERIGDEAIANPGVNPLALVTNSGRLHSGRRSLDDCRLRFSRSCVLDGCRLFRRLGLRRLVLQQRRGRCKLACNFAGALDITAR